MPKQVALQESGPEHLLEEGKPKKGVILHYKVNERNGSGDGKMGVADGLQLPGDEPLLLKDEFHPKGVLRQH